MSILVKIPAGKEKAEYSLYVNGEILHKHTEAGLGTLLWVKGTAVAFYSASNSRRAVIFQELSEYDYGIPLEEGKLPYIKQKVRVLYKARGRKIDLLKFTLFNLEKKYTNDFYSLGTLYWLELASYIDSIPGRKKIGGSTKRQPYMLTDRYIRRRKRLNENLQGHSQSPEH